MARIALLSSLCIALRFAFFPFPNIKPITAIFLVSLSHLPLSDVLILMTLTMIGTGLYMGFGVVVLWQILSFGLILSIWRVFCLPLMRRERCSMWLQLCFVICLVMGYGLVISFLSALQYGFHPLVYWLNGLGFDLAHATSTSLFYPIILAIFRRIEI